MIDFGITHYIENMVKSASMPSSTKRRVSSRKRASSRKRGPASLKRSTKKRFGSLKLTPAELKKVGETMNRMARKMENSTSRKKKPSQKQKAEFQKDTAGWCAKMQCEAMIKGSNGRMRRCKRGCASGVGVCYLRCYQHLSKREKQQRDSKIAKL